MSIFFVTLHFSPVHLDPNTSPGCRCLQYGDSPLHRASEMGHIECIRLLATKDSKKLDERNAVRMPATRHAPYASISGRRSAGVALDWLTTAAQARRTALHKAAFEGRKDACALLIDLGAAVDALDQASASASRKRAIALGIASALTRARVLFRTMRRLSCSRRATATRRPFACWPPRAPMLTATRRCVPASSFASSRSCPPTRALIALPGKQNILVHTAGRSVCDHIRSS